MKRRVIDFEETLVVVSSEEEGKLKHNYHLSNAGRKAPLRGFARVTKAKHRIEECLKRGKSEAGLADYQVIRVPGISCARSADLKYEISNLRSGQSAQNIWNAYEEQVGWHHHQALSLLALWFLVQEAWRGKKAGPALTVSQVRRLGDDLSQGLPLRRPDPQCSRADAPVGAERAGATVPLQVT